MRLSAYPRTNRFTSQSMSDGSIAGASESVTGYGDDQIVTLNNPSGASVVTQQRRKVNGGAWANIGDVVTETITHRMTFLANMEYQWLIISAGAQPVTLSLTAAVPTSKENNPSTISSVGQSQGFRLSGNGSASPLDVLALDDLLLRWQLPLAQQGVWSVGDLVIGSDSRFYRLNSDKGSGIAGNPTADPVSGSGLATADWVLESSGNGLDSAAVQALIDQSQEAEDDDKFIGEITAIAGNFPPANRNEWVTFVNGGTFNTVIVPAGTSYRCTVDGTAQGTPGNWVLDDPRTKSRGIGSGTEAERDALSTTIRQFNVTDVGAANGLWTRLEDDSWALVSTIDGIPEGSLAQRDASSTGVKQFMVTAPVANHGLYVRDGANVWQRIGFNDGVPFGSAAQRDSAATGVKQFFVTDAGADHGVWVRDENDDWVKQPVNDGIPSGTEAERDSEDVSVRQFNVTDAGAANGLWTRLEDDSWVKVPTGVNTGSTPSGTTAQRDAEPATTLEFFVTSPAGDYGLHVRDSGGAWQRVSTGGGTPTGTTAQRDGQAATILEFFVTQAGVNYGKWVRDGNGDWARVDSISGYGSLVERDAAPNYVISWFVTDLDGNYGRWNRQADNSWRLADRREWQNVTADTTFTAADLPEMSVHQDFDLETDSLEMIYAENLPVGYQITHAVAKFTSGNTLTVSFGDGSNEQIYNQKGEVDVSDGALVTNVAGEYTLRKVSSTRWQQIRKITYNDSEIT